MSLTVSLTVCPSLPSTPFLAALDGPCFDFCGRQGPLQGKPVDKLPLQAYAVCSNSKIMALPTPHLPHPARYIWGQPPFGTLGRVQCLIR